MKILINDLTKCYCDLHEARDNIDFSLESIKLTENNRYIFHGAPIYNEYEKSIIINNDDVKDIIGYYVNANTASLEILYKCRANFIIYDDSDTYRRKYDTQFKWTIKAFESIMELIKKNTSPYEYDAIENNIDKEYIITLSVASLLVGVDITRNIHLHLASIHTVYAFKEYILRHGMVFVNPSFENYLKKLVTNIIYVIL